MWNKSFSDLASPNTELIEKEFVGEFWSIAFSLWTILGWVGLWQHEFLMKLEIFVRKNYAFDVLLIRQIALKETFRAFWLNTNNRFLRNWQI